MTTQTTAGGRERKKYPESLKIFNKEKIHNKYWIQTCAIEVDQKERYLLPTFPDDAKWKEVWKWAKENGKIFNMTQEEYYKLQPTK